MRKFQIFQKLACLLMVVLAFTMTGCMAVNLNSPDLYNGGETIGGKGSVVTRDYDVDYFDSLLVYGNFEVIYKNGPASVTLEMQENLMEYVEVSVTNGILRVGSWDNLVTGSTETLKIYVYTPALTDFNIHGLVTMKSGKSDVIRGDRFNLTIDGGGDLDLELDVKIINTDISGAGSIKLSGTADYALIDLSGAGDINALGLKTTDADVSVSGAGSASIYCSGKLNIELSGVGSVEYDGNPEVTSDVSGIGTVERVDQ